MYTPPKISNKAALTCYLGQVSRRFNQRPIRIRRSGRESGGCIRADTGVEYCWDGVNGSGEAEVHDENVHNEDGSWVDVQYEKIRSRKP
jgi:hypothetical protein